MKKWFRTVILGSFLTCTAEAQEISVQPLKQLLSQYGYSQSQKQDTNGNYTYYYKKKNLLIVLNEDAVRHSLKNAQATMIVDNQSQQNVQNAVNDLSSFFYKISDKPQYIEKWLNQCMERKSMNIQTSDRFFQYKCFLLGHSSVFLATPIK